MNTCAEPERHNVVFIKGGYSIGSILGSPLRMHHSLENTFLIESLWLLLHLVVLATAFRTISFVAATGSIMSTMLHLIAFHSLPILIGWDIICN